MSLVRHGSGPAAAVRALASQVHPVFMLPAVAASLFGGVVAPTYQTVPAAIHGLAIFFALYTAHAKDGYVDFYRRGEDDDHPLTARGCRVALAGATICFALCLLALWIVVGPVAALVTLPCWLIAYHHAPQLDTHPLTATLGYPSGISLAILGGYYVQTTAVSATILAYAAVFFVTLAGVKVIDDAADVDYDRSIGKHTVAVVVGRSRAKHVGYAAMAVGMAITVASALTLGPVPTGAALAPIAFGAVALVARTAEPELATMLLIRGVYLFLATLLAVIWLQPLQ